MNEAMRLAGMLKSESEQTTKGVRYSTAKQAARELLRQEQAIAELADSLQWATSCLDFDDEWPIAKAKLLKARAALAKHTQEKP